MRKSIKGLLLSFLILIVSVFVISCKPDEIELNISELNIEAVGAVDVAIGDYVVAYTLDDLNDYVSTFNLSVEVLVIDNESNDIDISEKTFSVEAGKTYTVTINVFRDGSIIKSKAITVMAVAKAVESIFITTQPSKLIYIEGEAFQGSGIVVTALYNDLSRRELIGSEYIFSKTDALLVTDTSITVTHTESGKTTVVDITVSAPNTVRWTVNFIGNGAQLVSGNEVQNVDDHGAAIAPVYTRENYIFEGFDVSFDDITAPITVTALWIDLNQETLGLYYDSYDNYNSYYVEGYSGTAAIVVIPSSYQGKPIMSIKNLAFNNMSSITTIYIPDSLKNISFNSFGGCDNLESFIVSPNNPYLKSVDGVVYDKSGETLLLCPPGKVGILNIIQDIISIGDYALFGCRKLTEIVVPDSVYDIKEYALGNTNWYEEQPNGLVYVGKVLYKYKGDMPADTVVDNILPDTKGIAAEAFSAKVNLKRIVITGSILTIGSSAFSSCSGLTSVIIPPSVIRIDSGAFNGCSNLSNIFLSDTLMSIGSDAFKQTPWYASQKDGIVYAGKVAYKYKGTMESDTALVLKEGTIAVADFAFNTFEGLNNLVSICIPSSVKRIGSFAFSSCRGMTMIQIPSSVDVVADNAFTYTVTSIYAESLSKPIGWAENWNPDPRPVIWNCGTEFIIYTFDTNEGELLAPNEAIFLSYLPLSTKTGFTQVGWHLLPGLTDLIVTAPFYPETKLDTTLYAEWEVARYAVQFVVEGYSVFDEGDGLIQQIEHGSSIINPPILTGIEGSFIAWTEDLNNITKAMAIRPVFAGLSVDTTEVADAVTVSVFSNNDMCEVWVDKGSGIYCYCFLGDSFEINKNTTLRAKASFEGGAILFLDDLVITNIDSDKPSSPKFDYKRLGATEFIQVVFSAGEDRGSGVKTNQYRLGEVGGWVDFTFSATITCKNNTLISARTQDNANNWSSINQRYIRVDILELEDHDQNDLYHYIISEEINLGSSGTNNIIYLSGEYLEADGEYRDYVNTWLEGSYKGCGLYAAQAFANWFGIYYDQDKIQQYVETTDFGKYMEWLTEDSWADPSIFTTPTQLDNGLQEILNNKYDNFEVVRKSPNSKVSAIAMIEDYLSHGYPVVMLVNDGEHWQVISKSDVVRDKDGEITSARFLVHDARGARYRTWSQLDYFFEDNYLAEAARACSYTSYIDTIMSIRYVDTLYTVQEEDWSSGWSEAEFFTVNDNQYLFLLKKDDGLINIKAVNADGTIGQTISANEWVSGIIDVSFYYENGNTYVTAYKPSSESFSIYIMNSNGSIGERTHSETFPTTAGQETNSVKAVTISGKAYIATISSNSQVGSSLNKLYELSGGVLGNNMGSRFSVGENTFINAAVFEAYGNSYVLNSDPDSSETTRIKIYLLDPSNHDDPIRIYGESVNSVIWTAGWSNIIPYEVNGEVYLFISKAGILDQGGIMAEEYGICQILKLVRGKKTVVREDEYGEPIGAPYEIDIVEIGPMVDSIYWPPAHYFPFDYGYNVVRFYENSLGETMLFALRESDGVLNVRKINSDGRIATNIR